MVHVINDLPQAEKSSFNFSTFADVIEEILTNPSNHPPLTIAIDGPWGTGKTTLMKMIESRLFTPKLNQRLCIPVWFNAWQYSSEAEILPALLHQILQGVAMSLDHLLDTFPPEQLPQEGVVQNVFRRLSRVLQPKELAQDVSTTYHENPALYSATMVVPDVASLAAGEFVKGILKRWKHRWSSDNDEPTLALSNVGIQERQGQSNPATTRHELLTSTREFLEDFCGQTDAAICVFIDDLDWCTWGKIPEILEGIKLHLDNAGCFFVLGLDTVVASHAIEKKYLGNNVMQASESERIRRSGEQYLEKIIQLRFRIPSKQRDAVSKFTESLLGGELLQTLQEQLLSEDIDAKLSLQSILACLPQNPRQIKRFLNSLILAVEINRRIEKQSSHSPVPPLLLAKLEAMQYFKPELFVSLSRRRAEFLEVQSWVTQSASESEFQDRASKEGWSQKIANLLIEDSWFRMIRVAPHFDEQSLKVSLTRAPDLNIGLEVDTKATPSQGLPPIGSEEHIVMEEGREFFVDVYPVTCSQYAAFLEKHTNAFRPSYWPEGELPDEFASHPVSNLSGDACQAYATAHGRRLLSSDEWIYLATSGNRHTYPWGDEPLVENGNVYQSGHGQTTSVQEYPNGYSRFGVYDLIGNVSEWTREWSRWALHGGSYENRLKQCLTPRERPSSYSSTVTGFRTCRDI